MTVITDTFIPYEFADKRKCYNYVTDRALRIRKSLRLVEKDEEHLTIRCPVVGDYLDIVGTKQDIEWLDAELRKRQWYRET